MKTMYWPKDFNSSSFSSILISVSDSSLSSIVMFSPFIQLHISILPSLWPTLPTHWPAAAAAFVRASLLQASLVISLAATVQLSSSLRWVSVGSKQPGKQQTIISCHTLMATLSLVRRKKKSQAGYLIWKTATAKRSPPKASLRGMSSCQRASGQMVKLFYLFSNSTSARFNLTLLSLGSFLLQLSTASMCVGSLLPKVSCRHLYVTQTQQ